MVFSSYIIKANFFLTKYILLNLKIVKYKFINIIQFMNFVNWIGVSKSEKFVTYSTCRSSFSYNSYGEMKIIS